MWVLDHLADLASDFSAVHRITDMLALPARTFFALAYRLPAYQSVMALREAERAATRREDAAGEPPADDRGRAVVSGSRLAIMADPLLSSVISFAGPPPGSGGTPENSRAGKSPADPANTHLLKVCPICDEEDPDGLTPGTESCGSWMCWPAHAWCIDDLMAST